MAETVLVTGATGFVGRHLVDALSGAGYRVRAALRTPGLAPAGAEPFVIGDLGGEVDWRPALAGIDCVVHLAGIAHATGVAADRYDRINHRATADLAGAAARQCVRRLVFVSSVLAQTPSSTPGLVTEDRAPAPAGPYGASKLAAERALREVPIEAVVLRPPLIYGAGVGGNMGRLVRLARRRLPLPFGALRNRRSLLAIENLASAIRHCLSEPRAAGGTFLVADDTPLSLPAMIAALRSGAGRAPGLVSVSPAVLGFGARLAGAGDMWQRLAGDLAVSNGRLRALGWTPHLDSVEGLAKLASMAKAVRSKSAA